MRSPPNQRCAPHIPAEGHNPGLHLELREHHCGFHPIRKESNVKQPALAYLGKKQFRLGRKKSTPAVQENWKTAHNLHQTIQSFIPKTQDSLSCKRLSIGESRDCCQINLNTGIDSLSFSTHNNQHGNTPGNGMVKKTQPHTQYHAIRHKLITRRWANLLFYATIFGGSV